MSGSRKSLLELREEGRLLADHGVLIVLLYPTQEWMALQEQVPYLRYFGMKYPD